jgi:hypothetical protein
MSKREMNRIIRGDAKSSKDAFDVYAVTIEKAGTASPIARAKKRNHAAFIMQAHLNHKSNGPPCYVFGHEIEHDGEAYYLPERFDRF